jgi:hypothetical protein
MSYPELRYGVLESGDVIQENDRKWVVVTKEYVNPSTVALDLWEWGGGAQLRLVKDDLDIAEVVG